jgi:hypothetical protein
MLLNIRDHIGNHFNFTLIIILKVSVAEWDIQFENLGSIFLCNESRLSIEQRVKIILH